MGAAAVGALAVKVATDVGNDAGNDVGDASSAGIGAAFVDVRVGDVLAVGFGWALIDVAVGGAVGGVIGVVGVLLQAAKKVRNRIPRMVDLRCMSGLREILQSCTQRQSLSSGVEASAGALSLHSYPAKASIPFIRR